MNMDMAAASYENATFFRVSSNLISINHPTIRTMLEAIVFIELINILNTKSEPKYI
jgi:hypothetical protein